MQLSNNGKCTHLNATNSIKTVSLVMRLVSQVIFRGDWPGCQFIGVIRPTWYGPSAKSKQVQYLRGRKERERKRRIHSPFQAWIYHCHLHPLQDVDKDDLMWFKNWRKLYRIVSQFHGNSSYKTFGCRTIKSVCDVKLCFNTSWGLKGLKSISNNKYESYTL